MTCDLAHFNLAHVRHPLDHPAMAGFVAALDEVNRLAAASPGFVWTPADGDLGDPVEVFGSPSVIANVSTWRSLGDLQRFVYGGLHAAALARRREWFESSNGPAYVLWWVPSGCRPTWVDARERLEDLAAHGPTARAFTFRMPFEATPGERGLV